VNYALRKIASGPMPDLASRAFFSFKNLVSTGLMTAEALEEKLVASSNITATDAIAALPRRKGNPHELASRVFWPGVQRR